jgi:6-methylsalicylate decarboxylase
MTSEPALTGSGAPRGLYDVHFHYVPDAYREVAIASGFGVPDGMPGLPVWSEALMVDMMEQNGIEKGFLSISSPGVHFGNDQVARALARRVNEEGARLKAAHPGRLGLFAAIPLPDVDGALFEINHALDVLGADGIYLQSNAGGIYPGESTFDPIFAELNRRGSIVFIHPTSPACPCCGPRERRLPRPVLEFMFETTRAVTTLILSGTLERYPNVKIIVPHGGATLSVLADRIAMTADLLPNMGDLEGKEILPALARLYYDLAGVPTPRQLVTLRTFADPSHLFYGSDWPHTPQRVVDKLRCDL